MTTPTSYPAQHPEDGELALVTSTPAPLLDQSEAPVEEAAREPRASRLGPAIRELAETLLLALLIYLTVRGVVQNFKVEGSSMEPTLHHGQYLLVNKLAYVSLDPTGLGRWVPFFDEQSGPWLYPLGTPQRGDIVVFRYPRDPSRDFIKRVVALPGETVEIRAGNVYIDNQLLQEFYVGENPTYSREPAVVPPRFYFVLGDNRNNSSDSHVWGPVPMEHIVGKAWLTYWPVKDWGGIPDHSAAAGGR